MASGLSAGSASDLADHLRKVVVDQAKIPLPIHEILVKSLGWGVFGRSRGLFHQCLRNDPGGREDIC